MNNDELKEEINRGITIYPKNIFPRSKPSVNIFNVGTKGHCDYGKETSIVKKINIGTIGTINHYVTPFWVLKKAKLFNKKN